METVQYFPSWSTSVALYNDTTDTIVQKWAWQQRQKSTHRSHVHAEMPTDSIAEINCVMQTWSGSPHHNDLYYFSKSFNLLWRKSTGVVTHTPTNWLKTHSSDCSAHGSAQNSIKRSGATHSLWQAACADLSALVSLFPHINPRISHCHRRENKQSGDQTLERALSCFDRCPGKYVYRKVFRFSFFWLECLYFKQILPVFEQNALGLLITTPPESATFSQVCEFSLIRSCLLREKYYTVLFSVTDEKK